jgi:ubiquinone/menaquinone biosynthesis C-methylase UbiE
VKMVTERSSRVFGVAAGPGSQSIAAARRVGSDDAVLATDISPSVLASSSRKRPGPACPTS